MNVIDLPQRTPAWLEWRAGGVSASDVAILLGLSPYKTPWRLWAEKTGLVRSEAELSQRLVPQEGNRRRGRRAVGVRGKARHAAAGHLWGV